VGRQVSDADRGWWELVVRPAAMGRSMRNRSMATHEVDGGDEEEDDMRMGQPTSWLALGGATPSCRRRQCT
jgi:hypothetical protein